MEAATDPLTLVQSSSVLHGNGSGFEIEIQAHNKAEVNDIATTLNPIRTISDIEAAMNLNM